MPYAGESFGNAGKKGKNAFVEPIVMRKLGLRVVLFKNTMKSYDTN